MKRWIFITLSLLFVVGLIISSRLASERARALASNRQRSEVVFWHFWGGADRDVVEDVVQRFNDSQDQYFVRAIAMPGNNLQAKLFLSIAGGDPPDLVNQDDPIVGDWAFRHFILPLDEICAPDEAQAIAAHLLPAARRLGMFNERLYGVCNGLDIRALYYNQTILDQHGLPVPQSTADLDQIAKTIRPPGSDNGLFGYLPDSRRLWAWGYVFGGDFYDADSAKVQLDQPPIRDALQWMTSYADWYGADTINRFRQGDQSLPGKTFPLLPVDDQDMAGRYIVIMDGQWRTRDINAFVERRSELGIAAPDFGVCPLPPPAGGRRDAGWVNGNFFVVPRGARNTGGAVAFMKFWIGLDNPDDAARTCAAGGWIPVSQTVINAGPFQDLLNRQPLFREFVRLAGSENQFPVPVIPGAPMFKRTVEKMASDAMTGPGQPIDELLQTTGRLIQGRLDQIKRGSVQQ